MNDNVINVDTSKYPFVGYTSSVAGSSDIATAAASSVVSSSIKPSGVNTSNPYGKLHYYDDDNNSCCDKLSIEEYIKDDLLKKLFESEDFEEDRNLLLDLLRSKLDKLLDNGDLEIEKLLSSNEKLIKENNKLKERLDRLESLISSLTSRLNSLESFGTSSPYTNGIYYYDNGISSSSDSSVKTSLF